VKQDEDNCDLDGLFSPEKGDCNIGVVHSDISGDGVYGSCVIDVDGGCVEIVDEAILIMKNDEISNKLLNTVQTLTPRGKHILLKYKLADFKDGLGSRTIFSGQGHEEIKLIARGGFTVEPPSKRKDGVYKFVNKDFDKIAKLTKEELDYVIGCIGSSVNKQQKMDEEPSWVNNERCQKLMNKRRQCW
jgi:Bifunctional DNA primase/polymerase, N-terminal